MAQMEIKVTHRKIVNKINHKSKNKKHTNRKIDFLFDPAHWYLSCKYGHFWEDRGGLHIVNWEKPNFLLTIINKIEIYNFDYHYLNTPDIEIRDLVDDIKKWGQLHPDPLRQRRLCTNYLHECLWFIITIYHIK